MDYLNELHRIGNALSELDNTVCDTIEEANDCLIKYDKLKGEIISTIKQALEDCFISETAKEHI
jgi:hypothetical protein